jgi:NACalpha-BTF3-like transcription factor
LHKQCRQSWVIFKYFLTLPRFGLWGILRRLLRFGSTTTQYINRKKVSQPMRIITNEAYLKRGRQIGTVMFFVSLLILTGGLLLTNFLPVSTELMLVVPLLVMPLGLVTTIVSVRLTNEFVRVPRPEAVLAEALDGGVNPRSVLYNYFSPKHVLITPEGVYSITVRFQTARAKVEGDTWTDYRARGIFGRLMLFMRQEGLGKIQEDALNDAAVLQGVIDEALPDAGIEALPIVVFVNPKAVIEISNPTVAVAYASQKRKPTLKSVLRDDKKDKQKDKEALRRLSDKEIELVELGLQKQLSEKAFAEAVEEVLE